MPPDMLSSGYRSPSTMRARNALLARAGIARTFGGLGSFLAVIFLGAGIYLLQESFTDPLQAQAVGLIAGAFIIALATILIYFIFTPRKRFQSVKAQRLEDRSPADFVVPEVSPSRQLQEHGKVLHAPSSTADATASVH
jgi:uncharacterized membrane protein YbhN (UPF0104 family)